VVDRLREDLGLEVAVLRAARLGDPTPDSAISERLYEAEWLRGTPPRDRVWRPLDGLPDALAVALARASGEHQPWYRPGWFAEMSAWVDGRLADAGIRRRGPIRQVRSWGRSALVELATDHGRMWAKQVPAVFAHEIRVTGLLADVDPGLVPPLVAADVALGRMLIEHVEGSPLPSMRGEPAAWTATLGRLAEAQRVLAEDPAVLSIAGVASAPVGDLETSIPRLLADDDLLLLGRPGGLTDAEAAPLRARSDDLVDAARRLSADGIPVSLDHGDLSAGQVIVGAMGPVILDWSDATVTHPFLAAASFLMAPADLPDGLGDDLAAAYLAPWSARATAGELRTSLQAARLLHPLHMAGLYAERILPGLDQPWEMERMVPWFLRSVLERPAILPG
jgi:hypothetical protein